MPQQFQTTNKSGITVLEVVIVLVTLAFLAILAPLHTRGVVRKNLRIQCLSNLKQVSLGFRMWADEQKSSCFSFALSTNAGGSREYGGGPNTFRHFQAVAQKGASPRILVCPEDRRRINAMRKLQTASMEREAGGQMWPGLGNQHVSYFINLDARLDDWQTVLLGDGYVTNRNFDPRTCLLATSNNPPQWSQVHSRKRSNYPDGNIALADGSVRQIIGPELPNYFSILGTATNRLALP